MKEGTLLYKISLAIVPRMLSWLIKAWFATCRVTVHDAHYREQCREHDNPVIATFWHYAILYNLYHMRKKTGVAMVSASKDGEYIARLASFFGYAAVRGSRNRKGMQAMKEMMKLSVKDGMPPLSPTVRKVRRRWSRPDRYCWPPGPNRRSCRCSGRPHAIMRSIPGIGWSSRSRFPGSIFSMVNRSLCRRI